MYGNDARRKNSARIAGDARRFAQAWAAEWAHVTEFMARAHPKTRRRDVLLQIVDEYKLNPADFKDFAHRFFEAGYRAGHGIGFEQGWAQKG